MSYVSTQHRAIFPAILIAIAVSFAAQPAGAADERVDRTGSRAGGDATGRTVIRFDESSEVRRVRSLLEAGDVDSAVQLAEEYLASLDSAMNVGASAGATERYYALNALCAALTKAGRVDEAVARCTEAIELIPSRWSAHNNRGTAYFIQRNYVSALEDYENASEFARGAAGDTVEHNIALTEERLAESDPGR